VQAARFSSLKSKTTSAGLRWSSPLLETLGLRRYLRAGPAIIAASIEGIAALAFSRCDGDRRNRRTWHSSPDCWSMTVVGGRGHAASGAQSTANWPQRQPATDAWVMRWVFDDSAADVAVATTALCRSFVRETPGSPDMPRQRPCTR
jgi:hypothetical protein